MQDIEWNSKNNIMYTKPRSIAISDKCCMVSVQSWFSDYQLYSVIRKIKSEFESRRWMYVCYRFTQKTIEYIHMQVYNDRTHSNIRITH